MRRYGLGILAIISLLIVVVVGMGYLIEYRFCYPFSSNRHPNGLVMLTVRDGCISGNLAVEQAPTDPWDHSFDVDLRPRLPNLAYAVWKFHFSDSPHVGPKGGKGRMIITYFPIWCVLLPCSIAPVLWLRRRRRQRTRGFPIAPAANAVEV